MSATASTHALAAGRRPLAPADYPVHLQRRAWLLRRAGYFVAVEVAVFVALLYLLAGSLPGLLIGAGLVLLTVALLTPWTGGRSPLDWFALRYAYGQRQPEPVPFQKSPPELVPLAEWVPGLALTQTQAGRGEEIGVLTDGEGWSAVLGLVSDDDLVADAGDELDLVSLRQLTVQDDIVFAGIQVLTYTVPAPTTVVLGPGSAAAEAYQEITGRIPPAVRRTWLCVRLDPRLCLAAVARRGEGTDGIYAALRFGLHRVQSLLKRQGIATRALTSAELGDVLALTSGARPEPISGERSAELWDHWVCDGLTHTSHLVRRWGVNPSRGYGLLLRALAGAPVLFALTSYTLSPRHDASAAVRLVTADRAGASAAAAAVEGAIQSRVSMARADGAQVPTLLATVPLGRGVSGVTPTRIHAR